MSTSCIARSIITPTSLIRGGNGPTLFADADTTSPITSSFISSFAFPTAGLNLST
jgi:hypothetical protein